MTTSRTPRELDGLADYLRRAVLPREAPFAVVGVEPAGDVEPVVRALIDQLGAAGHPRHEQATADTRVVLNVLDAEAPVAYRRRSAATFVVAIVGGEAPEGVLQAGYPYLLHALANLCPFVVPTPRGAVPHVITLEPGVYPIEPIANLYEALAPLALSRLVIRNRFRRNLSPEAVVSEAARSLSPAGRRLDALGLLPAPFPLEELLSERDLLHVKRLFGIGGLSYGNLSARAEGSSFWMSGSGVDKSQLDAVGQDILFVEGYDAVEDAMVVRVPPETKSPRRVSVDAIEHWMIYREHPDVGAIVHVHGWIDGVEPTRINYPCGTIELAQAVADAVRRASDASQAVVGQWRHGLTLTGESLDDIFERLGDRIQPAVPMDLPHPGDEAAAA